MNHIYKYTIVWRKILTWRIGKVWRTNIAKTFYMDIIKIFITLSLDVHYSKVLSKHRRFCFVKNLTRKIQ